MNYFPFWGPGARPSYPLAFTQTTPFQGETTCHFSCIIFHCIHQVKNKAPENRNYSTARLVDGSCWRLNLLKQKMQNQTEPPLEANPDQDDQMVEIDLSSITSLDLTGFQLPDLDSVELPPNLIDLDLTTNRLSKLDSRIANLINLRKLSFRQNLFNDAAIEPISSWESLTGLEVIFFFPFTPSQPSFFGLYYSLLL